MYDIACSTPDDTVCIRTAETDAWQDWHHQPDVAAGPCAAATPTIVHTVDADFESWWSSVVAASVVQPVAKLVDFSVINACEGCHSHRSNLSDAECDYGGSCEILRVPPGLSLIGTGSGLPKEGPASLFWERASPFWGRFIAANSDVLDTSQYTFDDSETLVTCSSVSAQKMWGRFIAAHAGDVADTSLLVFTETLVTCSSVSAEAPACIVALGIGGGSNSSGSDGVTTETLVTCSSVSDGGHKSRQLELASRQKGVAVRTATRTVRTAISNYKAAAAEHEAIKQEVAKGKLLIAAACIELAEETHRELQRDETYLSWR